MGRHTSTSSDSPDYSFSSGDFGSDESPPSSKKKAKKKKSSAPEKRDASPKRGKDSAAKTRVAVERGKVWSYGEKNKVEVASPDNVLEMLREEFGTVMFDPCPLERPVWDGLERDWEPVNYINPPFNAMPAWIEKGLDEVRRTGSTAVFFFPSRTSSRYWEPTVFAQADEIRFVTGSIRFKGYDKNCPFPMVIVVVRPSPRLHGLVRPQVPRKPLDFLTDRQILNDPYVQENSPLLWFAVKYYGVIARPHQGEFIDWRHRWALTRCSSQQLFANRLRSHKSMFFQVMFGLLVQLSAAEKRAFGKDHGLTARKLGSEQTTTLFRLFSSLRTQVAPLERKLRKFFYKPPPVVNEAPLKLLKLAKKNPMLLDACHFYIVYKEYRMIEWMQDSRISYLKESYDGKFALNTVFLG